MIKRLVGLVALSLVPAGSLLAYSNVVVFGDSLSDIGNMPEAPALLDTTMKNAMALNLYVPISNPIVNGSGKVTGSYVVPGTNHSFPYPQPVPGAQPDLHVNGKAYARQFKSLAWPQFFANEAYIRNKLPSPTIEPWLNWVRNPVNKPVSIDYAFAGATTDNECRNFEYAKPNPACTEQSILVGQQQYIADNFSKHPGNKVGAVQIPGLLKQISLFENDKARKANIAGDNTLYVILIGGNDINLSLLELSEKKRAAAFKRVLFGAEHNVSLAMKQLINKDHAKHIVIMNLLNMQQSPYIQHSVLQDKIITAKQYKGLQAGADFIIKLYNTKLHHVAFNKYMYYDAMRYKHIDIGYFDTYAAVEALTQMPKFANNSYRTYMCLQKGKQGSYYVGRIPCATTDGSYTFWNGVHPTNLVGEYVAHNLLNYLQDKKKD